jgi:hypothetical protein
MAGTLLPVVRFAVWQRVKHAETDYWDYATLLELEVLDNNEAAARRQLEAALARVRENWEPTTTARNLRLIQSCRNDPPRAETRWVDEIIERLEGQGAAASAR